MQICRLNKYTYICQTKHSEKMTYSQDDLLDSDLIPHHVIAEIDKHGEGEITEVYKYDERGNIDWRNNIVSETSENHSAWFEAILESWHPSDAEVEKADWGV